MGSDGQKPSKAAWFFKPPNSNFQWNPDISRPLLLTLGAEYRSTLGSFASFCPCLILARCAYLGARGANSILIVGGSNVAWPKDVSSFARPLPLRRLVDMTRRVGWGCNHQAQFRLEPSSLKHNLWTKVAASWSRHCRKPRLKMVSTWFQRSKMMQPRTGKRFW